MLIAQSKPECRDTAFKTIHVKESFLDADIAYFFPSCDSGQLMIRGIDQSTEPVYGIATRHWTLTGPDGTVAQSDMTNPEFVVPGPGDYVLKYTVTTGNGCTETLTIPFDAPIPPAYLLPDSVRICPGDTAALFPAADPLFIYSWSPAAFLSDTAAPNPLAFPPEAATYRVTISGNGPCVAEGAVPVVIVNPASLTATASPDTIFAGQSSQLQAVMSGQSAFFWTPVSDLSNPSVPNPVATPDATTDYVVNVSISGSCILRDTVRVVVRSLFCEEPYVFFPTGFSPNDDGENDALKLESNVVEEVYWVVFNRWGEKVFEANTLDDFWDGTFRGKPQPAETYGYYLRVRCPGGEEFIKKGNVTLLR
jgi:gliding motility-associated-like protein